MQITYFDLALRVAAVTCCALFASAVQAEIIAGRVIAIGDGDTLTLQDAQHQQHPVRLAGIDAPELAQAFGQQAKTGLSVLALNQQAVAHCANQEPNRPALCAVTIGGKDIGLAQIRNGWAWWYRENAAGLSVQAQSDYRQAEFEAKIHRLGLWNSKNPIPPWQWRHERLDD